MQLPNFRAELQQTNPRIETALTEQELLLPEMEREISPCSSCDKQGILPTFCLVPLGGIGAALLQESDQVIEGDVEINGKHDGGCKPKHLKGKTMLSLKQLQSARDKPNPTKPTQEKLHGFCGPCLPKMQGGEMVCEPLVSPELQLLWEPDK